MTNEEFVSSLRQVVDFYEKHVEIPLPDLSVISVYDWNKTGKDTIRIAALALGTCEKESNHSIFEINKKFGQIELRFVTSRNLVCTRRVVGTKTVEAIYRPSEYIPKHEEEIVEWDCPESILAPKVSGDGK